MKLIMCNLSLLMLVDNHVINCRLSRCCETLRYDCVRLRRVHYNKRRRQVISERKFVVDVYYNGVSKSIHEDIFSMKISGPELRGHIIIEHYGEVSYGGEFFKDENSSLQLSDRILEFDCTYTVFGKRSILALMKKAEPDSYWRDEYHLLEYQPHIEDVLKRLERN